VTAAILQFTPALVARDAIGGHVLGIDAALRDAGVETGIYTGYVEPELSARAQPYAALAPAPSSGPRYLLYHSSIGSEVADFVLDQREPKLVDYHNMTPPDYFAAWRPEVFVELTKGRRQLSQFASVSTLALADSAFNAGELVGLGFRSVSVVPILLDVDGLMRSDAAAGVRWAGGDGARWLFVGRVAPNKAQHDVVKAFAWYRRVFDAGASLTLVGGVSAGSYWSALERFVEALGLSGAVRLAGSVPDAELEGLYRSADVFVCLSEHEGFCVPLLEAMAHGVPVVALGAAAVPETLGDAGLLLGSKRPGLVAEAVARVMGDAGLRAALVAGGRERLQHFDLARSRRRLLDALAPILETHG
jgi:L-malate glycosyltransferase